MLILTSRLTLRKKRLLLHLIQLVHQGLECYTGVVQRQCLQTCREHRHEVGVVSRPVIGCGVQCNKGGAEVVPGSPRRSSEIVHMKVLQGLGIITLKWWEVILLVVQALEKIWRKGKHRMQARAWYVRVQQAVQSAVATGAHGTGTLDQCLAL